MKNCIQELRHKAKLTQEELGQSVGVSRQTIISIENGKYTASLLLAWKIAQHFGLAIEAVFDFTGEEE